MNIIWKVLLMGMLVFCQSCATSQLWADTRTPEWIWIDANKISEAALQQRGVEYRVQDTPGGKGYLIKSSMAEKMKDFQLRMLGTPVTLAVDAATTVAVVGVYLFLSDPVGTLSLLELAGGHGGSHGLGGHR
jgi:hypothetical protein